MSDEISPDELLTILHILHHGTASEREAAILHLQCLVNKAAGWPEDDALTQGQQLAIWGAERDQLLNRPHISDVLLATIEDPSVRVRATTALMLGNVKNSQAEEALTRHLLTDPADHVRIMCCAALRFSHEPHIVDAFIAALEDSQEKVVYSACMALGESGDVRAVPSLQNKLGHPSWMVRYHAAEALVQLGAVDTSLIALIKDLAEQPQALRHDEIVTSANTFSEEIGETERSLTTRDVLEKAHRIMQ